MGARICGVINSANVDWLISRFEPRRPLSSTKRIHFDMSLTLDHT
jgi:hypothetical protein